MQLTPRIVLEIISHEAIVRQAYKDSVGVWTWSVGITSKSGHRVERYINNPQPMADCLAVYVWLLEKYADTVRKVFRGHELTEGQFCAALSFHWSTGKLHRASWPKHWKAGRYVKARKSFMDWRKPPEIIPRRRKERDLFFDGKWSHDGVDVTEYTRVTARGTPDWSSAKRVDIEDDLMAAMAGHSPGAPPDVPGAEPTPKPRGIWQAIMAIIKAMFGKGK